VIGEKPVTDKAKVMAKSAADAEPWKDIPTSSQG
jgi:hypothetical protein